MHKPSTPSSIQALKILSDKLGPAKVVTSGKDYDAARRVWNAAVDNLPDMVVLCACVEDVQAGVQVARSCGVSLTVRGGGHDWAGRATSGAIVLDLTRMNSISIDGKVATVGGGATSIQLAEAASRYGVTPVIGVIGSVGVAGLVLGGGYGHLTGRAGMALDHLLGAEVVLADGSVVDADAEREPDLFWALKGGGGNFGVVTKLQLRLLAIPDLSNGTIAFPWDQARRIVVGYDSFMRSAPDDLTLLPVFAPAKDGSLNVVLAHSYCGDPRNDVAMSEQVAKLGAAGIMNIQRKTLATALEEAEARTMSGVRWIVRTVTLASFGSEAIDVIIQAMENRSSPLSWIAGHPFYGVGETVTEESTAFGIRTRHFMVGIYTAWVGNDDEPHRTWADGVETALSRFALPSAYPNYFGADRADQARHAYGKNAARLLAVKKLYDPSRMFSAISLPLQE